MRRIASDPGATERLRETRRATVSRIRSDLAVRYVRANSRLFLEEYGIFHFRWFAKGRFLFHAHEKVNIRRKRLQHPKRDPIVKPRRLRLCGFPRFCSVSHDYTSQNFDCVPQRGALHSIVILSGGTDRLRSFSVMTRKVFVRRCAAACCCRKRTHTVKQ